MVKGDDFTGLIPAAIIRCLQVQHRLRLGAEYPPIGFADDHGSGTRSSLAVRPGTDCRWLAGITPLAGALSPSAARPITAPVWTRVVGAGRRVDLGAGVLCA